MIRILIADDHALIRQGLRQLLSLTPDLRLVAEARNGWEVVERVRQGGIDVLLLDLSMPGHGGFELIRRVKIEAPRVPVLVLSMHADAQVAARTIKAGASGYLTKDSEPEMIIDAIRRVSQGGNIIDPALAADLVFNKVNPDAPHATLTNREYQIFLALAHGSSQIAIAEQLNLSAKTVSTHKFRLMRKLGLESVSELVRYAVRHGLVE